MVFGGDWGAKQGHNDVAQHLVDGALEAMHGVHHDVQGWVQEPPSLFWVKTLDQLRRAFDVGEEDRDLFTLAFQDMPGGQDLLGEMRRDRGAWHTRRRQGGGWQWGRGGVAGPHQNSTLLIDRKLFGRDDFVLEGLEMVVVHPEPDLDRPIGEPPLALQQVEYLCEDLVKRHGHPSTYP